MSRISELHDGLMKDPAYANEFAKLEGELAQLRSLVSAEGSKAMAAGERRSVGRDHAIGDNLTERPVAQARSA